MGKVSFVNRTNTENKSTQVYIILYNFAKHLQDATSLLIVTADCEYSDKFPSTILHKHYFIMYIFMT